MKHSTANHLYILYALFLIPTLNSAGAAKERHLFEVLFDTVKKLQLNDLINVNKLLQGLKWYNSSSIHEMHNIQPYTWDKPT